MGERGIDMILDEHITSREMRAVEMNAEYLGVSKLQLMENAGLAVAEAVMDRFKNKSKVVIACGPGGTGETDSLPPDTSQERATPWRSSSSEGTRTSSRRRPSTTGRP
jgi:hypothetical protein